MAKVLVIRKPDRTIHTVGISNKATLMAYNNRLPVGQRWVFEEMDEKEAAKLPAIDPNYVTAGEATTKLKESEAKISEKDSRIAELEKMLEALNGGDKKESKHSEAKASKKEA